MKNITNQVCCNLDQEKVHKNFHEQIFLSKNSIDFILFLDTFRMYQIFSLKILQSKPTELCLYFVEIAKSSNLIFPLSIEDINFLFNL